MDSSTCVDEKVTESTSIKDKTINSDYSNRSSNVSNMSFNENIMNDSCNSTKNNSLIYSNISTKSLSKPSINNSSLTKSQNESSTKFKIIDQIKESISKNKRDKMSNDLGKNNLSDCIDQNQKTIDSTETKTNTKYLLVGFNYLFLIFCLFYHFIKRTSIKL
jgi:hypothetical protein